MVVPFFWACTKYCSMKAAKINVPKTAIYANSSQKISKKPAPKETYA